MESNRVTQAEFARRMGVSRCAVSKAIKAGKIKTINIDGRAYIHNTDQAERAWKAERGDIEPEQETTQGQQDTTSNGYTQANLMYKAYKAQLAKIEYEEKKGKLVDAVAIKNEAYKTGKIIQSLLQNIPDRISSILAAETSERKIHAILTEEIDVVLEMAVERLTKIAK